MEFKEIWAKLSKIDVNEHVKKKGKFSYLGWTWGWATLMEHYPEAVYEFGDNLHYPDGSIEVWVTVTIGDHSRTMWLPVMDNSNKAMSQPDAREVSDTRMRCLVKCLAMFGLGFYIYAGESVPDGEDDKPKAVEKDWYNDFDKHKEKMIERINKGEAVEVIIESIESKYKLSKEVKSKIMGLK